MASLIAVGAVVASVVGRWPLAVVAVAGATFFAGWLSARASGEVGAAPEVVDPLLSELDRARRFAHPFSVVRLAPGPDADGDPVGHLARTVRSIDRAWDGDDATYLLLPETGRDGARRLLDRLLAESPAADDLDVRLASFPDDELTSQALLERLARPRDDAANRPDGRREAAP